jgi:hypothetical protein
LVGHDDGEFYRAVCSGILDDNKFKFIFVDFGVHFETGPKNVWPMPEELATIPIISRTVQFKLKSGKGLENVDVESTFEKLNGAEGFHGFIESHGKNKYSVTIDDSLARFNN